MGWLEEANKIVKNKTRNELNNSSNGQSENNNKNKDEDDILLLDTERQINEFKSVILHYYEDATDKEMDKAIDKIKEHFDKPYSISKSLNYIKQYVG